LRYVSWNVNGIRSALKKGFDEWLADAAPDALCLQEVRALPEQVDLERRGYNLIWHPADRKGYSGTAVLSRREPLSVKRGLPRGGLKGEGRVLVLEFADHWLVDVYVPNVRHDLSRLPARRKWNRSLLLYLRRLAKVKPVACCGDFNVSHRELDLARPGPNRGNAGFTDEEREDFSALLEAGFIDTFREFESGGGHYSWWSYRANARARNIGWRLDYFFVSENLLSAVSEASILSDVYGSDHCPVSLTLNV